MQREKGWQALRALLQKAMLSRPGSHLNFVEAASCSQTATFLCAGRDRITAGFLQSCLGVLCPSHSVATCVVRDLFGFHLD